MTTRPLITIGTLLGLVVITAIGQERTGHTGSTNVIRDRANSIHRALGARFEADFTDVPLHEVLDIISKETQIPIWADTKTLSEEGISTDTTVTLKLRGVTLRAVMDLLLNPLLLTFVNEDGVLKITTQTAADEKMTTRVYPVKDLLSAQTESDGGDTQGDYRVLMDAIHSSTPGKWEAFDGEGGRICPVPIAGSLVIRQTQKVQVQVDGLLTALRKAKHLRRIPSIPTDPDDYDEYSAEFSAPRRSTSRYR